MLKYTFGLLLRSSVDYNCRYIGTQCAIKLIIYIYGRAIGAYWTKFVRASETLNIGGSRALSYKRQGRTAVSAPIHRSGAPNRATRATRISAASRHAKRSGAHTRPYHINIISQYLKQNWVPFKLFFMLVSCLVWSFPDMCTCV